ncbi:MAG: hypothetical protein O2816_17420 [Planctomycetota bacterium]|nr:hypothetical protein [Planctomycetota bacterium]
MHSWVYRNRARLKLIYGSTPLPPIPEPSPALPAAGKGAVETWELLPEGSGEVERAGQDVTLRPMPRRPS